MGTPKGRRTGRCTICQHPERYRMELLLVSGAGRRAIARKFQVSADAVWRHGKTHISDEQRAQMLGGPVKLRELASKAADEGLSLLEYLSLLRSSALTHYLAAGEANDMQTATALLGRLTDLLRLQGQFTGDLTRATANVTNNTLVLASPAMADFEDRLIGWLKPFPDALRSVLAGLQEWRAVKLGLPAPERDPAILEHCE